MTSRFLNLRHLYQGGTKFATAIPRTDHVAILVHKYQDVQVQDLKLSYEDYRKFINQHRYVEKTPGGVNSWLPDLSDQTEEVAQQETLFDYI